MTLHCCNNIKTANFTNIRSNDVKVRGASNAVKVNVKVLMRLNKQNTLCLAQFD